MGYLDRVKNAVRPAPSPPPPPSAPPRAWLAFERYKDTAGRVAIVDTETTGIYNHDRVVEVAVVTLNLRGQVIDRWDTLVNPGRDVGPTHIHGITPSMVAAAPRFEEVADELATRLHGAILCSHNLPFDARMVGNEYGRCGAGFQVGSGFDTLTVTGTRLGDACAELGIRLDGAHQALDDALATAQLLLRHLDRMPPQAVPASVETIGARPGQPVRRQAGGPPFPPPPFLASVIASMRHTATPGATAAYIDLLDRAMADLHIDHQERAALAELASSLGLVPMHIDRANRTWFGDLLTSAAADGHIDDDEYDQLLRAAHVLNLGPEYVAEHTNHHRTRPVTVDLTPGLGVTFTGVLLDEDPTPLQHLRGLGLRHEDKLTKSRTGLLVSDDPATTSGKTRNARKYGIPVAHINDLMAAPLGGTIPATIVEAIDRQTVECSRCGRPFTRTKTRSRQPASCESCA